MHSENFERFFSYYHKMIQSLENFFVSNKRDLTFHFRFLVDRLLPKTRSIILKLSKREELLDFPKKKKNGWHAILHFQRSAEESKEKFIHLLQTFDYPITQRIPFSSRNFGEVFFLLSLPFCFAPTRKSTRSFICCVSTSRSSNLGWNSRPRLAGCEPLQGSAPLFSLLSSSLRFSF